MMGVVVQNQLGCVHKLSRPLVKPAGVSTKASASREVLSQELDLEFLRCCLHISCPWAETACRSCCVQLSAGRKEDKKHHNNQSACLIFCTKWTPWEPEMSHRSGKPCLVVTVSIITFTSIITLSYFHARKYPPLSPSVLSLEMNICSGTPARGTITPLQDNRTLIIAAYFDNRERNQNVTRLIGISHYEAVTPLYCWFCCPSVGTTYVAKARREIHSDRFGFPYGAFDMRCLEPKYCEPNYVTVHGSPKSTVDQLPRFEIRNREAKGSFVEFTICISPMFGKYNNILQFLQSVEMYKILGVGKVVIYKNSCSPLMEKVLDFYAAEGTVEVIAWPIDSYLRVSSHWHYAMDAKDLGYYGQIAALNDCIYRYMYNTKYVLLNDIDEIILPMKYPNWGEMMQKLQKRHPRRGVFFFENRIFPITIFTPIDPVGISSWSAVPGVNILEHVFREPSTADMDNPVKMIVDPRKVIQTSVHVVLKAYRGGVLVPGNVASVFHCRKPLQTDLPRQSLIKDTRIWRYKVPLVENVNRVLQKIGLEART
ncbi:uncharacterized protein LOC128338774 isoform X2 [Hemicordylus capensis]|uniref:uncharacterized protein LOC128338774 isoform X2 n=1 Tax=Hemicordylus capensis TaxID=884348 RepID=UPI002303DFA6|nr:uncharacterized protein LOC128338774 isoform X2 [Hemicordylus capensis]